MLRISLRFELYSNDGPCFILLAHQGFMANQAKWQT